MAGKMPSQITAIDKNACIADRELCLNKNKAILARPRTPSRVAVYLTGIIRAVSGTYLAIRFMAR